MPWSPSGRGLLVFPTVYASACKAPQGTAARLGTAISRRMEPGRTAPQGKADVAAMACRTHARPSTRSTSMRAFARLGRLHGLGRGGEPATLDVGDG